MNQGDLRRSPTRRFPDRPHPYAPPDKGPRGYGPPDGPNGHYAPPPMHWNGPPPPGDGWRRRPPPGPGPYPHAPFPRPYPDDHRRLPPRPGYPDDRGWPMPPRLRDPPRDGPMPPPHLMGPGRQGPPSGPAPPMREASMREPPMRDAPRDPPRGPPPSSVGGEVHALEPMEIDAPAEQRRPLLSPPPPHGPERSLSHHGHERPPPTPTGPPGAHDVRGPHGADGGFPPRSNSGQGSGRYPAPPGPPGHSDYGRFSYRPPHGDSFERREGRGPPPPLHIPNGPPPLHSQPSSGGPSTPVGAPPARQLSDGHHSGTPTPRVDSPADGPHGRGFPFPPREGGSGGPSPLPAQGQQFFRSGDRDRDRSRDGTPPKSDGRDRDGRDRGPLPSPYDLQRERSYPPHARPSPSGRDSFMGAPPPRFFPGEPWRDGRGPPPSRPPFPYDSHSRGPPGPPPFDFRGRDGRPMPPPPFDVDPKFRRDGPYFGGPPPPPGQAPFRREGPAPEMPITMDRRIPLQWAATHVKEHPELAKLHPDSGFEQAIVAAEDMHRLEEQHARASLQAMRAKAKYADARAVTASVDAQLQSLRARIDALGSQ